jgi:hypothetical protein
MVAAAGTILLVAGGLLVLGGFVISSSEGGVAFPGLSGNDAATTAAVVAFVFGGLHIVAGLLVLRLSSGGRALGIVLAVIGLVGGLAQLGESGASGLLSLALYAFVLYGLLAFGYVFKAHSSAR